MTDELISVLIPTFNVECYVYEAVQSILAQTYSNLEIIIVDDASTDNTFKILNHLAQNDPRIKLYKNAKNMQIAETLNFALKKATGNYIARMDGDDISTVDRIEKQKLYLDENPDIALVSTSVILIDENGKELRREKLPTDPKIIEKVMPYRNVVPHFWLTYKKVYDRVGNYRIPSVEDYDFLLRLLNKNDKIANHSAFLYRMRSRPGNTQDISGLIQRKSFDYALALHKERNVKGHDSYSLLSLKEKTKVSKSQKFWFSISTHYQKRYIRNKKNITGVFFFMLCILTAPFYQIQYYTRKVKCFIIMSL